MKGKIKRLASIWLVAMMLLSFLPTVSAEITGEGTEASPYLISSVSDLQAFATDVNSGISYSGKYVKLTASLDLTDIDWKPIGKTYAEFKGTFDGGHHVIKGLSISTSVRYAGFFGKLSDATVKNLGIENATVESGYADVAVLAGNAKGGLIENCYVTGSVTGSAGVGGILGSTHSSSYETTIRNCYARVAMDNSGADTDDWAGISGWNESTSVKIINCYSACIGEIRPIAGWSDGSPVSNSQFVNTYFDKTLSPDFSSSAGRTDLGKTSDELKTQSTFTDWDFTDVWAIDPDVNGGYPYLQGFDSVTLSGAPGTLAVILTYESGDKITDATVTAIGDNGSILELVHQADGIYSSLVPNTSATYAVSANGEAVGEVAHNGKDAIEKAFKLPDPKPSITYSYAYDAQRSPAFPASKGAEITANGFAKPMKSDENKYDSNAGTWTLTEVGFYGEKSGFTPAPTSYLDGIVNTVASRYDLDADGKNGLIIHKLTDENDELVAYGLIISVDEDKEYALFIGDVWSNSGAGYLLSNSPITDSSVTFNTDKMVQSTYSVSLSTDAITFDDAEEGYSAPSAQTVTITNTGDIACGALEISASGSDFTLNKSSIADIAVGGSDTFTVVPKTGLAPGTYTEEITVSGDKIMPETLNVSFTVTAPSTYTVSFNANGGSGKIDTQVVTEKTYTLPECAFTAPENKIFYGWATSANGEVIKSKTYTLTGDTTFYPVWGEITEVKYTTDNGDSWSFDSLMNAIWKYGANVEIKLLKDITLTSSNWSYAPVFANTNAKVTIDGQGHTITRGDGVGIFATIGQDGSTVTLKNITIDGGAVWNGDSPATRTNSGYSTDGNYYLFDVYGGTLVLDNGAVIQNAHLTNENSYGGAVAVQQTGTLVMNDGAEIKDCTAASGGGVCVLSAAASFTMNGGKITGCYATSGGGAVLAQGTFTMNDGELSNNASGNNGGAVTVSNNGVFTLVDGAVKNNASTAGGGAITVLASNSILNIKGGEISGNTITRTLGGGILVNSGTFNLSGNPVIKDNLSGTTPCNIYLGNSKVINIADALSNTTQIGVTMLHASVFTSGWNGYMSTAEESDYFVSEDDNYILAKHDASGELILTAKPGYTVSFNANGGSGNMADVESPIGEEYTLPDCTFTAPSGMEFAGWDKGNPGDKITLTDNTTLTAQWQSIYKDYAILQNDINHVREVVGSIADVTEKDGKIVIKLKSDVTGRIRFDNNAGSFLLDLNGHTITPGNQNEALCLDNNFTGTVTVTGEGTLKKGKNNIVYNWKGTLNFAVAEGSEYFSLKNGDDNVFAEKNTTTKNYSGTFSRTGDSFVLTQGTLGTYTVSFDANGGSGTMSVQTVKELTETALSENTFERSGYNFTGWNKAADGSDTAYADKASVKDLATSGGSITLYAQWTKIPAAAPSVSASGGLDLTYGAIKSTDAISVLATSDASTYDLSYQWYKDGSAISGATSASYTIPASTTAGTYTYYCKVTATRRDNGLGATAQSGNIAVNVAKASIAVPSVASKVYTGATLKADISDTADYTVTQNNGGISAGSYDVVLTLVDSANYKWSDGTATSAKTIKFAITKSNANAISDLAISGWTYGESGNVPSASVKFGTVTYKYAGVGSTSYNSATAPNEAGTYKVIASVAETNDYNGATAEKEFTIAQAQAVITVDTTPIVKTYGEALALPTVATNFGTVTVDKTSAELKNAGTYTVTYKVSETRNWKGDTKTVDVTINKKPVEILWGTSSFVYDGNEKTVTAEISNAVDADVVTPTLSGNTATNAGDYTASVVALDNANYTLDGVSATKAWKITQATNEWTSELSISGWTYGDAPAVPAASAKFGDVIFTYSDAEDGTYESEVPTNAGTWYVKAEVYETPNFTGISSVKSFIIEKAVPTVGEAPKTIPIRVNDKVGVTKVLPGIILGADGEEITGTYSWENSGRILDRDSSYTETLIFTPEDTVNYEVIEFDATINTYTPSGLIAGGDKTKPQPAVPQKPSGEQESSKLFDDVPVGIWFEEAAEWMGKNGYMSGTASRTFSPYIGTSRGMVVTVLWRIAGSPEPNGECPFEDVPKGSYYETAITWAQENGVVTGHSDTIFKPDDLITREQLAAIIYRNEVRKGMEAVTLEENLASFADAEKVSAYAIPAMNWAVGEGLMNGVSGNTLAPQKDATRAETATIIYRMENK